MGFCKIEKFIYWFQKGWTRVQLQWDQSRVKINSVISSASNTWDSWIFELEKGLSISLISPTLPWTAHIDCFIGSGWPHARPAAVLGAQPMVLVSQILSLTAAEAALWPVALVASQSAKLLQLLSRTPHAFQTITIEEILTHCQVQLLVWNAALVTSGPQLLCADPEEILLGFHLSDSDLF